MLKRATWVGPVATNRPFVSFVHVSVTVQGLLITGAGLALLAADLGAWGERASLLGAEGLFVLLALLAALYLMASEKILRDRHVLQKLRESVARASGSAGTPETVSLGEHFLRMRTLYHFLMLCCFLLYVATRLTPAGHGGAEVLFHVEWGFLLVFYVELLLGISRLRAAYARLVLGDLGRLDSVAGGTRGAGTTSLARRRLGDPDHPAAVLWLRSLAGLRTVTAAAAVTCLAASASGVSLPQGAVAGPWIGDAAVIALGLTFTWFNVSRERFLRFVEGLGERIEGGRLD